MGFRTVAPTQGCRARLRDPVIRPFGPRLVAASHAGRIQQRGLVARVDADVALAQDVAGGLDGGKQHVQRW